MASVAGKSGKSVQKQLSSALSSVSPASAADVLAPADVGESAAEPLPLPPFLSDIEERNLNLYVVAKSRLLAEHKNRMNSTSPK
jgi:hypothetical protein